MYVACMHLYMCNGRGTTIHFDNAVHPKSRKEIIKSKMADIGLYGLAVMGQNFALNMASKGFSVRV